MSQQEKLIHLTDALLEEQALRRRFAEENNEVFVQEILKRALRSAETSKQVSTAEETDHPPVPVTVDVSEFSAGPQGEWEIKETCWRRVGSFLHSSLSFLSTVLQYKVRIPAGAALAFAFVVYILAQPPIYQPGEFGVAVPPGPSFATREERNAEADEKNPSLSESDLHNAAIRFLKVTYRDAYIKRDLNELEKMWDMDEDWREALQKIFAESDHLSLLLDIRERNVVVDERKKQVSVPVTQSLSIVRKETVSGQKIPTLRKPSSCIAEIELAKSPEGIIRAKILKFRDDVEKKEECRLPAA